MNHIICTVEYENGAIIKTSFVTNLETDIIIQTCPELTKLVNEKTRELKKDKKKQQPKYEYPDYVIHAAAMQKLARYGVDFKIHKQDCTFIRKMDAQEKKAIFGGGLLLSEKAAAENKRRENALLEQEQVERFELSEREKQIVRSLG